MALEDDLEKDLKGLASASFADLYEEAGKKYGLDPAVLRAVAHTESGGDPEAIGEPTKWGRAKGLMQLLPETAKALGVKDPFNPREAIFGAAKLLKENLQRYGGDMKKALLAYHGGTDETNWGPKTQAYPNKVLGQLEMSPSSEGITVGPAPRNLDDELNKDLAELTQPAEQPPASKEVQAPTAAPNLWNGVSNFIHSSLLGAGIPVEAAGAGARQMVESLRNGMSLDDAITRVFPQRFKEVASALKQSREQWTKENPGKALTTELAGAIPATVLAMTAGGRALEAGGAALGGTKLAQAYPEVTKGLQALGRFVGGTAGEGSGVGNFLLRQLSRGTAGALQGAVGNTLMSQINDEDVADAAKQGAMLGIPANVIAGPVLEAVAKPLTAKIAPAVGKMAQAAEDLGLPLRGGQLTTSPVVQKLDKALVGADPEQLLKFTRSVSKTFGEDTDKITQEVMDRAGKRIGLALDDIAIKAPIDVPKTNLINDLAKLEHSAKLDLVSDSPELKTVLKQIDSVANEALTGNISGKTYQSLTSYNSPLGRAMRSSSRDVRYYAAQLRNKIDDALEASAPTKVMEDLRAARQQFKNLKTVEDLVEKAQPSGVLDPQALLNAVRKSYSRYGYSGAGDIGTLAEAGRYIPSPGPSGAPLAEHGPSLKNALIGAGAAELGNLGLHAVAPGVPAATAAGAYAASKAVSKALESRLYREILIKNGLGKSGYSINPLIPLLTHTYNSSEEKH